MSDHRKIAHLEEQLGEERWQVWLDPENTGRVKDFCDELLKNALPAVVTLAGRVYDILGFLKGDEEYVVGHTMVDRAEEMRADLGQEDGEWFLEHQEQIPAILRGKVVFVFTGWRRPGYSGLVACVCWDDGRWIRRWGWLGDYWNGHDRLLHHAVYRILYPFFDQTFITDSFSCRLDKGTQKAINRFRELADKTSYNNTATCWVLKGDIKKFFASINHGVLLDILSEYIPDGEIMRLLKNIIESFSTSATLPQRTATPLYSPLERGKGEPPLLTKEGPGEVAGAVGLPLGNLTSQLFANVYLNVFDQWVKHCLVVETHCNASLRYIRYADDFVILSRDKNYLLSLIPKIQCFLSNRLKLTPHPNKIILKTLSSGADFLGWINFSQHRVLRRATRRRMFTRLRENTGPESLQSYLGLLGHGNARKLSEIVKNNFCLFLN